MTMHLRSILVGTVNWVLGDLAPTILEIGLRPVSKAIVNRAPKGVLLLRRPSVSSRLDLRAGHVADERKFVRLNNLERPVQVDYVVHEHLADKAGRHFDLRLSYKGKAVSWAIPMDGKRLRMDHLPRPGQKVLALRQPDHVLEYMNFEGVIPEGYGKGDVKIWDRGIADILKIEGGNVHIRMYGPKSKGDYTIVNTGGRKSLLVAKKPLPADGWLKPPYVRKNHKLLGALQNDQNMVAEAKVDGAALELRIGEAGNRLFSHRVSRRTGRLVEHTDRLPHLRDLKAPKLAGTDLRVEAWHPKGVNFLSGTLNSTVENARSLQNEHGPVRAAVFDVVRYKGKDVRSLPYQQRQKIYQEVSRVLGSPSSLHSVQVAGDTSWPKFYDKTVARRDIPTDGVIVKDSRLGHAEKPWIKVKPHDEVDCKITSVSEGLGKHSGRLGALTVETPEGKHVQVGTGFTDGERGWLWSHREGLPGEVIRARFHVRQGETTASGPRFAGFHPDKASPEVLKMYADLMDDRA
jgi:DNA ligase D-like protein (predicted 3'-phosphoesterase)